MAKKATQWWSVRVELLGGAGTGDLWPAPGRIFAVSTDSTFHDFAEAIDDAFARWDRSHLHEFEVPRLKKRFTEYRYTDGDVADNEVDADTATLGQHLQLGDEFIYTFDLGDNWRHRCAVAEDEIDDVEAVLGIAPERPMPYWGWGEIPDAYGRLFDGDDGEKPIPDPPTGWPWPNAPEATIVTERCPGQWTRTRTLRRR